MELGPEEIQETPEKRMRRKGETTVDMGSKEDALTRPQLRLCLPLRQPHGPDINQTKVGQLVQSSGRSEDWIQSPCIQPGGSADLDDDPRFVFLPFAAPVAFFTRSSTVVLSFTMVAGRRRRGWRKKM